jgi:predicted TIM-barrel fold metal-dependent hydrolase
MCEVELVASVYIEAAAQDPVAETRWLDRQAEISGLPTAIVVGCNLEQASARETLEAHMAASRVTGVRQMLNWHEQPHLRSAINPHLLGDRNWRAGFGLLAEFDLSFDLSVYPHQLLDAARLAADFPSSLLVLNHGGLLATGSEDERELRRAGLGVLSQHENVLVKISGFGINNLERGIEKQREWFHELLELFGASRCMIGSDYPVDKLVANRNPLLDLSELSGELSAAEDQVVRIGTATRAYRLPLEIPNVER